MESSSLPSFKLCRITLETHKSPSPDNMFPLVVLSRTLGNSGMCLKEDSSLDKVSWWVFIVTLILSFNVACLGMCDLSNLGRGHVQFESRV